MANLNDALRYPTVREDWYRTIVIGGVLSVFAFLIIPIFLIFGYLVRVMQAQLMHESDPPYFAEWADLFVVGFKGFIIGFVYMLIPLIVMGITIGGAAIAFATGTDIGTGLGVMGLVGGGILTALLVLLFGYVTIAGIVNFARTEQLGDGFDLGTVGSVIGTREYAVAWLSAVLVLFVAAIIAGALNEAPVIGVILGAFLMFYAQMVAASQWADGFDAAFSVREHDIFPEAEESPA